MDGQGDSEDHGGADEPLGALEIIVVCATNGDNRVSIEEILKFLTNETVMDGFRVGNFFPTNDFQPIGGEQLSRVLDVSRAFTIEDLHTAAFASIALVFVTALNESEKGENYDKLMAAYGFLVARLGYRRVHLIYNQDGPASRVSVSPGDFGHAYSSGLDDIQDRVSRIAMRTKERREDDTQGLFEVEFIALPNIDDADLFEDEDFGAKHTLDILGLRFGGLADRLDKLLMQMKKKPHLHVSIILPSRKIVNNNRYLKVTLQRGGVDTLKFLNMAMRLAEKPETPEIRPALDDDVLSRLRFVEIDHIPTSMITAADIAHPEGRMLITPVFPELEDFNRRRRPRLIVRNKLSQQGVYASYRALIDNFKARADEANVWTLADRKKHEAVRDDFASIVAGWDGSSK